MHCTDPGAMSTSLTCKLCDFVVDTHEQLIEHSSTLHAEVPLSQCRICFELFVDDADLGDHIKYCHKQHQEKLGSFILDNNHDVYIQNQCIVCPIFQFSTLNELIDHHVSHAHQNDPLVILEKLSKEELLFYNIQFPKPRIPGLKLKIRRSIDHTFDIVKSENFDYSYFNMEESNDVKPPTGLFDEGDSEGTLEPGYQELRDVLREINGLSENETDSVSFDTKVFSATEMPVDVPTSVEDSVVPSTNGSFAPEANNDSTEQGAEETQNEESPVPEENPNPEEDSGETYDSNNAVEDAQDVNEKSPEIPENNETESVAADNEDPGISTADLSATTQTLVDTSMALAESGETKPETSFKCEHCPSTFNGFDILAIHKSVTHFVCPVCNLQLENSKELELHASTHVQGGMLSAPPETEVSDMTSVPDTVTTVSSADHLKNLADISSQPYPSPNQMTNATGPIPFTSVSMPSTTSMQGILPPNVPVPYRLQQPMFPNSNNSIPLPGPVAPNQRMMPPLRGNYMRGAYRNYHPRLRQGTNMRGMRYPAMRGAQRTGFPSKRGGSPMVSIPAKRSRQNDFLTNNQSDKDCQIISVQKRKQGLPVIDNVRSNKQTSSHVNLNDSVSLSVKPAEKSSDTNTVANLLATRGITVMPTTPPAPVIPQLPLSLSSAISITPAGGKGSQGVQISTVPKDNFAVPSSPARGHDTSRPSRPPTVDLTKEHQSNQHLRNQTTHPLKCSHCGMSFQNARHRSQHQCTMRKELGIPVVDLRNHATVARLASFGVSYCLPLSQLNNNGNNFFGIPLINMDPTRNPRLGLVHNTGATSVLDVGPLRPLPRLGPGRPPLR